MRCALGCGSFQSDGTTPLQAASIAGRDDVVKELLATGANVNQARHVSFRSHRGWCERSACTCAVVDLFRTRGDCWLVVPRLVVLTAVTYPSSACLDSRCGVPGPVHSGGVASASALCDPWCRAAVRFVAVSPWCLQRRQGGTTALFFASQEGHVPVVASLLGGGANVNQTTTVRLRSDAAMLSSV